MTARAIQPGTALFRNRETPHASLWGTGAKAPDRALRDKDMAVGAVLGQLVSASRAAEDLRRARFESPTFLMGSGPFAALIVVLQSGGTQEEPVGPAAADGLPLGQGSRPDESATSGLRPFCKTALIVKLG